MSKTIIYNHNRMCTEVIYNDNKIAVGSGTLMGNVSVFYNDILVPAKKFFGGLTSVFVAIENSKYVQYEVTIGLRWHCLSYYTVVKRQGNVLFSDK